MVKWPVIEGPDTPKICHNSSLKADVKGMRKVRQLGIDYVLMSGPPIPWKEKESLIAAGKVGLPVADYTGYVFNAGYARAMMQALYSCQ